MFTRSISSRRASVSTGTFGAFSQMLLRAEGRHGLLLPNSPVADTLRRSVVKRLPCGAPERVADRLGRNVGQIRHAHAGEITYSVDVLAADLLELLPDETRHCMNRFARLFDLWCIPAPNSDEESMA